jgi:hypothetical protein
MKASGLAKAINRVIVQGFLIFEVGQTSGMEHFSRQSWSLLKLTMSFPLLATSTTVGGSFGSIRFIASVHGVSLNLIFAMSAAMCTGAVGKTYSGFRASINSTAFWRSPWTKNSPSAEIFLGVSSLKR